MSRRGSPNRGGRGRPRGQKPPAVFAWMLLGIGLMAVLLAMGRPVPSHAAEAQPDVPVTSIPLTGDWDTSNSSGSGLRIAHFGSTLGVVAAGGTTWLCAHVTDGFETDVGGAVVSFWAEQGSVDPAVRVTSTDGQACVRFYAPSFPGNVRVAARAEYEGRVSPTAEKTIEVVGTGSEAESEASHGAYGPDPWLLGAGATFVVAGSWSLGAFGGGLGGPRPGSLPALVGAFSIGAGLIHVGLTPEHWDVWWGYGLFFVVVAGAQGLFGLILLMPAAAPGKAEDSLDDRRSRPLDLYLLGLAGTAALVGLYFATRIVGIPFLGPEAGAIEPVAAIDLVSLSFEVGLLGGLSVLLH